MKKEILLFAVFLLSVSLVSAIEPNIQFRGVSYEDSTGQQIYKANNIGDKVIVDAYVIDNDGYEDIKRTWLSYEGHLSDCDVTSTRTFLVNLICTATVESDMKDNTHIYLNVEEQDNTSSFKEIPYSPFDFQQEEETEPIPEMWGLGFKVKEKRKYGVFAFPEVKDYYYAKVGISVGGVLGDKEIERSSVSVRVSTKEKERVTIRTRQRDKPVVYELSDNKVVVEQKAYVRHTYYTKYNKTYSNGKVRERTKRHSDKGETTLRYVIYPKDRTVLLTFEFNGDDFELFIEDTEFMKQVYQNGISGRKVWVKY